ARVGCPRAGVTRPERVLVAAGEAVRVATPGAVAQVGAVGGGAGARGPVVLGGRRALGGRRLGGRGLGGRGLGGRRRGGRGRGGRGLGGGGYGLAAGLG